MEPGRCHICPQLVPHSPPVVLSQERISRSPAHCSHAESMDLWPHPIKPSHEILSVTEGMSSSLFSTSWPHSSGRTRIHCNCSEVIQLQFPPYLFPASPFIPFPLHGMSLLLENPTENEVWSLFNFFFQRDFALLVCIFAGKSE